MVQILPPKQNAGTLIGQALAQGLAKGAEQGIQRGQLQNAFNQLNPDQNYLDQLKAIAPTLLSTPGGAQALPELAGLLTTRAQNEAFRKTAEERRAKLEADERSKAEMAAREAERQAPTGQEVYRKGKRPSSSMSTFPTPTAGPQPQKEMSPQQIERYALDLMENSLATGKPIGYDQALNQARQANNDIRNSNLLINQEKQAREAAQSKLAQSMVTRAKNAGLIKESEDAPIVEKFAIEAQGAANDAEAWEYVRAKTRQYENAKLEVQRKLGLAGPFTNAYRKLFGNYKDEQEIIKDLQPAMQKFRNLGLYDEGKNWLQESLGFGNEQAHETMFPFSKEEKQKIANIPANTVKGFEFSPTYQAQDFPGDAYNLPPEKFEKFKDEIHSFLQEFPETNLVSLRGQLNREKRYSWKDIYRAIDELDEEGRFDPDIEQEKQQSTIRSAPIPGMGAYFKYLWQGAK